MKDAHALLILGRDSKRKGANWLLARNCSSTSRPEGRSLAFCREMKPGTSSRVSALASLPTSIRYPKSFSSSAASLPPGRRGRCRPSSPIVRSANWYWRNARRRLSFAHSKGHQRKTDSSPGPSNSRPPLRADLGTALMNDHYGRAGGIDYLCGVESPGTCSEDRLGKRRRLYVCLGRARSSRRRRTAAMVARACVGGGGVGRHGRLRKPLNAGTRRTIDRVEFVGIGDDLVLRAWYRFLVSERPDWWYWRCADHLLGPAVAIARIAGARTIFSAGSDRDVQPRHATFVVIDGGGCTLGLGANRHSA